MNSTEFCYWLQGYLELRDDDRPLTAKQVQIIKDHLALVFNKVTPDRKVEPAKAEEELDVWPTIEINPFDRPDVFCAPVTVAPPIVQPTMVPGKADLEEIVKKLEERQRTENPDLRTYCSPKTGVEYWAGRPSISDTRPGSRRIC
jgi:hypothetical protein